MRAGPLAFRPATAPSLGLTQALVADRPPSTRTRQTPVHEAPCAARYFALDGRHRSQKIRTKDHQDQAF